jgi:hypothetical protein
MGKFFKRVVVLGAAIGGAVFFWRKRQAPGPDSGPAGGTRP